MAATALTATAITRAGHADVTAVATDNTNGNTIKNQTGLHLILKNTDASSHTVTFTPSGELAGLGLEPLVVTIAASATVHCGGFNASAFGAELAFQSNSAEVTVAAYQVP